VSIYDPIDPQQTRKVNLSRIPKEKRAEAYARLQEKYPAQAEWLNDPFVVSVREHFPGCSLIVELPVEQEK